MTSSRYDKDEIKYRAKLNKLRKKYTRRKELYDLKKSTKPKIQFTKIALIGLCFFVVLNCTAVEVFAMFSMLKMYNLDALPALISAVVAESLTLLGSYSGYLWKSYSESKEEERIKLEREKLYVDTSTQDVQTSQDNDPPLG